MKHTFLLLLLGFSLSFTTKAQIKTLNSAEIQLAMQKLAVTGRVLYIAAHPDDENTRLLSYLASERLVRTAYLSLTRGDGGQNLIGKEQGEALGLIRTQELLAARRTDGAEQYFTRANDFGYSKNPEETFTFWNRDSILADVVYTIRRFRPDVIICRFPTTGEGGHGHHTASAMLALQAFDAAADPTQFAWQLSSAPTWQAKRIFWNTFNFGGTNTTSPDQLKIETGNYQALLGKSHGEIAADSRTMHKSQGFGTARQRGSAIEYFKLLKGDSAKNDLLDGVDLTWKRIKNTEKIQIAIQDCISHYEPLHPELSLSGLLQARTLITNLVSYDVETDYWRTQKLKEIEDLILHCAGVYVEALSASASVVPGEALSYSIQVLSRMNTSVTVKGIQFTNQSDSSFQYALKNIDSYTFKHSDLVATNQPYSEPYWLSAPKTTGAYIFPGLAMSGIAENKAAFSVKVLLEVQGQTISVARSIQNKVTDPVKGEVYRPIEVLPGVTINPNAKVYVFEAGKKKKISVLVKTQQAMQSGTLRLEMPTGWVSSPSAQNFSLALKGDEVLLEFEISAALNSKNGGVKFVAEYAGKNSSEAIRRIQYDHIPQQFFLEPAESDLVIVELKKKGERIAYIPGAGDDVAASLQQVGYDVVTLSDEQLKTEDLSRFHAIVVGVRAFNSNEKLFLQKEKLLNYVSKGGNLIVQYNTNSRIGPLQAGIGPYPFTISRNRVTDEKAEVRFLNANQAVLTTPNKITASDFENWIQERGIYFATECDPHYQKVFSMNDKNEKGMDGSLIIAPYGKGNFVYTGIAFFRQLPAGVPGAYRLFANIIGLPQNK
jgi:LmbE family N-acetylglucosaminyl deacetylase